MRTKSAKEIQSRFDTRLPEEQKVYFEKAAILGGYRSLTDFIILAAQEKAKEIINEKEQIIASERDSEIFFSAITKTKKPNKKLLGAAKKYKAFLSKWLY